MPVSYLVMSDKEVRRPCVRLMWRLLVRGDGERTGNSSILISTLRMNHTEESADTIVPQVYVFRRSQGPVLMIGAIRSPFTLVAPYLSRSVNERSGIRKHRERGANVRN